MKRHSLTSLRAALALLAVATMTTGSAVAATEQVVHTFNAFGHGGNPQASLIADTAGNLYGTASTGGSVNGGVAFKLTPTASGQWKETILHDFKGGTDGCMPLSGLVFDRAGNLYGTTVGISSYGCTGKGIVFELSPNADGHWTETIIHIFAAYPDGGNPQGNLMFDSSGNLYGTTAWGGSGSNCTCGTVFELSPAKQGTWKESILYSFTGAGDGGNPLGGVIQDNAGNLYGTTSDFADPSCSFGMFGGCGTVFQLTRSSESVWSEKTLHRFNNNDGANPSSGLIFDAAGNLYGTTAYGGYSGNGQAGYGVVFELSPSGGDEWVEKVLWSPPVGNFLSGLVLDGSGNLYGTAASSAENYYCGLNGCGSVFELSPTAGGGWHPSVLYSFAGNLDGDYPAAGLTIDAAGNLYGTTEVGGGANCTFTPPGTNTTGCGTVFKLAPSLTGKWTETQLYNFSGTDGNGPSGLTSDGKGNFYGTAGAGGAYGYGEVFKLMAASGQWVTSTLYSFTGGRDGANPYGVILDAEGSLYGATQGGGNGLSCGVVFKLNLAANDSWEETVLHTFPGGASADGCVPINNLVFDTAGNLYGATLWGGGVSSCGGVNGCGVIFKLAPTGGGKWTETVLHSFPATTTDGSVPSGGLVFDNAGNLFGTTSGGGSSCNSWICGGTAFELSPSSGAWVYNQIYSFPVNSGPTGPNGSLIFDAAGNLYGSSSGGWQYSCGAVFELSPAGATWTSTTLYSFPGNGSGCTPLAGLTFDMDGNLYGTSYFAGLNSGGGYYGVGTVFELSPSSGGWSSTVLYTFTGGTDGAYPNVPLIRDGNGNLYGLAGLGGQWGEGTAFEITP